MSKIISKSKESTITVEETGGNITVFFNGSEDDGLLAILNDTAENAPPMGGTFYPEPGTMLFYYNALKHMPGAVSVEGDIGEIPHEDGVIY